LIIFSKLFWKNQISSFRRAFSFVSFGEYYKNYSAQAVLPRGSPKHRLSHFPSRQVIPLGLKMHRLVAFSEPPSDPTWLENARNQYFKDITGQTGKSAPAVPGW
jgi:hypothetical protein